MFELKGKYNNAIIYTDLCDQETISQVMDLLNLDSMKDCKIRIMPDTHAGSGCVIGTTMTIKDKIIANLVGVDIGCLDKDSEVLTREGWIKISKYDGQEILVYDKIKNAAHFEVPPAYIQLPCNKFYHFHTKNMDMMLSPEHKMLVYSGYGNEKHGETIILAEDFIKLISDKKRSDYYSIKTTFDLDEKKGLGLPEALIRILVMVSADGRVRYNKRHTKTYVELHFKKVRKIARANDLLDQMQIDHSFSMQPDGTVFMSFTLDFYFDKNLFMFYSASKEELSILTDEIYYWDGTIDEERNHKHYSSIHKENADVVQFAFAVQGIRCGIYKITYEQENWNPTYQTYETGNPYVSFGQGDYECVQETDQWKYCFTTTTGFFVARRNDKIFITGNCGMLSIRLREKEIDFAKLDDVIRRFVPSGFDVHERAIAYSNAKDIIAPIDFEKSQKSLGSLGGGNHFIEVDKDDQGNNWLVIHTGSRHLGMEVCKHYQDLAYRKLKMRDNEAQIKETIAKLKSQGKYGEIENAIKIIKMQGANVPKDLAHLEGEDFANYVHDMKIAQEHAKINRATIAGVILDAMGFHKEEQFDTIHNYLDTENMILRKGAISAQEGERVLIPMNMRDGSLICIGKGNPEWNFSAPHGAGRLMSRAKAKEAVNVEEFRDSMAGIWSTSVGLSTLDESPFAYKPMESILENVKDTVTVDCIIKPLYNFKAGEKERLTDLTKKEEKEESKEEIER